jgi:hypothetical protein
VSDAATNPPPPPPLPPLPIIPFDPSAVSPSIWPGVVSGEFSKKADHGKWFGAKAKNHQQKEYHDPPEAER